MPPFHALQRTGLQHSAGPGREALRGRAARLVGLREAPRQGRQGHGLLHGQERGQKRRPAGGAGLRHFPGAPQA